MEQEDRIVERDRKLQDTSRGVRDERDLAENNIRPHINNYGRSETQQDYDRFEPRSRRDGQNQQNEQDRVDGDLCDFADSARCRHCSRYG